MNGFVIDTFSSFDYVSYEMKRIRGDRVIWTDEMKEKVSKKMSGKNNWNYGNPRGIKGYNQ